jgi:hypothetical protein
MGWLRKPYMCPRRKGILRLERRLLAIAKGEVRLFGKLLKRLVLLLLSPEEDSRLLGIDRKLSPSRREVVGINVRVDRGIRKWGSGGIREGKILY